MRGRECMASLSMASLEVDQLLNEASSEDGEDSHQSANLEDILATDDGSDASEDEAGAAARRSNQRTSSEADRLLTLILNEEDEDAGALLTPPEAAISPARRQAELDALLRRADETLRADPEPDAAASALCRPELPPAAGAPLDQHQLASEGCRSPRDGVIGGDGGAAAAATAPSVAAPVFLASGLTASEARTVAERAAAAAAAAATATDAARGGVALAEAAERRAAHLVERSMVDPLRRLGGFGVRGGGVGGGGGLGGAGASGVGSVGVGDGDGDGDGEALLRLETFPALNAQLGAPETQREAGRATVLATHRRFVAVGTSFGLVRDLVITLLVHLSSGARLRPSEP